MALASTTFLAAQEAQWIWAAGVAKDRVGEGACYFRRTFQIGTPEQAEMTIAADDRYELFVNGRRVGQGEGSRQLDRYDLGGVLDRGKNVIAIKVENTEGTTAALVARVQVKEAEGGWKSFSTGNGWKTSNRPLPLWQMPIYNDRRWPAAQSFGPLGSTEPWDRAKGVAVQLQHQHERFRISREFRVDRLLDDPQTGSVIAIAFNEFGQLILSQEGGPLLIASPDEDDPTKLGEPRVFCKLVSSCQGLLPLNGDLFVTGQGPDGVGLYRLSDVDRDGELEKAERLIAFTGGLGEHGPHGLTLGPDGMLYCIIGNFSKPQVPFAPTSPVVATYEGDLLEPKMEDPGGHAVGVKAPGGTVVRCALDGSGLELVAAGLRNSYDLAFNADGELFTYDSDMESDIGMTWYRPTRVLHVVSGAEFGWRSGWSKWPDYYVDSLPPLAETGRGSPTGMVSYDHFMFPAKYQGALFVGDWSEGRILAVTMRRSGAGYIANTEDFIRGEPLNVTDLDVGPDGSLYFATGGRATSGGIYRITWTGNVPDSVKDLGDDLTSVIRQPQLQSAWARQRVAGLRVEMDDEWTQGIRGVALATENPAHYRTRALDLLQLYGPKPDAALLALLVEDPAEQVRAKTAELLGLAADERCRELLTELLDDEDRLVRRKAAEGLVRAGAVPELASIRRLLISDDRTEAWAGRRLLERLDPATYRDEMLATDNHRLFIQCAVATMIAKPSLAASYDVLARSAELMQGFVSDRNFVDLLRVIELALERGEVDPAEIPAFAEAIADEFPSGNSIMNRELARILAYLKSTEGAERVAEYLASSGASDLDKIHVAMMLQTIRTGWTSDQRLALIGYLERARLNEGGGSYSYYVMEAAKELGRSATDEEIPLILAKGDRWPNAAVGAFYRLPQQLPERTVELIRGIDERTIAYDPDDDSFKQLKIGIVAVLGRSGDERSMAYLRRIWERDPERRGTVAIGLAQQPDGENWKYLVDSLGEVDEAMARDLVTKLAAIDRRPSEADQFRTAIELGLRLKENGSTDVIRLLEHWSGEKLTIDGDPWDRSLESWQDWFVRQFPGEARVAIDEPTSADGWDLEELVAIVEASQPDEASVSRGKQLFASARCAACHRYANSGESIGPDLTSIARRFQRREILEAIVDPSKVVSDQYRTQMVVTLDGRQVAGLVTRDSSGDYVVLKSDGEKTTIAAEDVDAVEPVATSSMPDGLIDSLSGEEVSDLMAFLTQGTAAPIAVRPETPTETSRWR